MAMPLAPRNPMNVTGRRTRTLLLIVLLAGLLSACQEEEQVRDEVLGYVRNTEKIDREFLYEAEQEGTTAQVRGKIEDSLRYQGTLSRDGQEVMEQVVDDDALAVRVINPALVPSLAAGTAPTSRIILETLTTGQWVVDPSGAPPMRVTGGAAVTGSDPVQDAVNIFRYVRAAIGSAREVKKWREDDIDPAYRPSEETFPPADQKKGIKRFDLVRLPLQVAGLGAFDQLPQTAHFRKMAIYVKGDRIVKILEDIDIDGHAEFREARERGFQRLLDLMRAVKEAQGADRIIPRKMSIEFESLGEEVSVRQPAGALAASLKGIFGPLPGEILPPAEQSGQEAPTSTTPGG